MPAAAAVAAAMKSEPGAVNVNVFTYAVLY